LYRADRVVVARPSPEDESEVIDAVRRSAALHHPWASPPDTPERYRAYLVRIRRREHFGFLARHVDDGSVVAIANINNVVFGAFRSGYLGYYVFSGHEGQGLMTETLSGLLQFAFGPMGLHRLEANIQPANTASVQLVERCGFRREGYSPRYLRIDGEWQDHERWAVTAD
jgi:ribosomal-protein-alanine N-acetyltransferase